MPVDLTIWGDIALRLSRGLPVTLGVALLASILALIVSFVVGTAELAPWPPVRLLARAYIETFRGTSALVQLFFIFYVLPAVGLRLPAFAVAVIGLALCIGAYGSQIVRAGILAVERGQRDAAVALGLSRWHTFRRIVLPQAIPLMLPPFGNELIDMLKATSLVSLLALTDLTLAGRRTADVIGHGTQVYLSLLLAYFVLSLPLVYLVRRLERRSGLARGVGTRAIERPT